jgi:t-SNARE complex subunit (syntaxin)
VQSVEVINNPARPGSNHRGVNYIIIIIIIIIIMVVVVVVVVVVS